MNRFGSSPVAMPRTLSAPARWITALAVLTATLGGSPPGTMAKPKEEKQQNPMHIENGILDDIRLTTTTIPSDAVVVIRPFSSAGADLGTGGEGGRESRVEAVKTLQAEGPKLLADAFKAELTKSGPFPQVRVDEGSELPENALVVEGRFTQIDPGSKAKRYWGGFGAGKSGLEVTGTVKNTKGELLAEFTQKRIAVMGAFGGGYLSKLRSDCESLGEDIARFLSAFAKGEKLTQ